MNSIVILDLIQDQNNRFRISAFGRFRNDRKEIMLIDTHAHVNFKTFAEDSKQTIQRALDEGVWVVNVGTQIDTSKAAVELAEKFEILNSKFEKNLKSKILNPKSGVYAVVGLHPVHTYSQHIDEEEIFFRTREENFDTTKYWSICQNPKVVGIGECGLDYFRLPAEMNQESGIMNQGEIKKKQKAAFIAQIKLAKELNKALVIHCRPSAGTQDAYEDILQILDQEFAKSEIRNPKSEKTSKILNLQSEIRYEIHSFTGTPEIAQEFLKRGAFVGLNGIITFDKTGNMQKVVETVPLERIVLETDCPYLTPIPHRGKRNEPAYVKYVAERMAEIKKISFDEVAEVTSRNAKTLFLLP